MFATYFNMAPIFTLRVHGEDLEALYMQMLITKLKS